MLEALMLSHIAINMGRLLSVTKHRYIQYVQPFSCMAQFCTYRQHAWPEPHAKLTNAKKEKKLKSTVAIRHLPPANSTHQSLHWVLLKGWGGVQFTHYVVCPYDNILRINIFEIRTYKSIFKFVTEQNKSFWYKFTKANDRNLWGIASFWCKTALIGKLL